MKRNKLMSIIIIIFSFSLIYAFPLFAQEKMTYEEYLSVLQRWTVREQKAYAEGVVLENDIEELKAQISQLESQIATTQEEIYRLLNITEATERDFITELNDLRNAIEQFGKLTPEEIYQRKDELEALNKRLQQLMNRPEALLTKHKNSVDELSASYAAVQSRMAKPVTQLYTVLRGDYLWKIAGMPQYYGDPMKWMRIYSVNSDQIKDPDLIYPNQKFTIPLTIDKMKQYLVSRGDFLYSIAQSVYGDPFQWRKLYENNRGFIADPNLIYPETILSLPGK